MSVFVQFDLQAFILKSTVEARLNRLPCKCVRLNNMDLSFAWNCCSWYSGMYCGRLLL